MYQILWRILNLEFKSQMKMTGKVFDEVMSVTKVKVGRKVLDEVMSQTKFSSDSF